ncbi:LysR family transcriptional regulator [Williamsia soli]|uniref:LysR family transcriptional regulator n=1 Tax=Williamsia soli TaxID=364929 RepID=UPI001A9D6496|nr:LysR family transcriptional regulator [Williamsia soli]
MDLPQLRCFVAVAEELHFARAAARLHLSPSPVSRMVKDLERELGCALFVRRHHEVQLTAPGEALVVRVREILNAVDDLKIAANAFKNVPPTVRIGGTHLSPPADADRFIEVTEGALPAASVLYRSARSVDLLQSLEKGELAAALVHLPLNNAALDSVVISHYQLMVAMRADDPLARRDELRLAELADRAVVLRPATPQPLALNRLHQRLAEAGIRDFHRMDENDPAMLASYIRHSRGLTLTYDPATGGAASVFADPAFSVIPLASGELEFSAGIAWNIEAAGADPVVAAIVAAIRQEWSHVAAPAVSTSQPISPGSPTTAS